MIRPQQYRHRIIIAISVGALFLVTTQLALAMSRHLSAVPLSQPVATPMVAAQQQAPFSSAFYLPLIQRGSDPTGVAQDEYTLTTQIIGQGNLSPGLGQRVYRAGQVVTLSVIADPGWQFFGWSGDLSGHDNPATVTMHDNYVITANFVQPSADPTATVSPSPTTAGPTAPTATNTPTFTNTPVKTPTFTNTPVNTPTFTNTPVNTPTFTNTPVNTPTFTNTPVNTPTFTNTPVNTPTFTNTPVNTPTFTNTPVSINQPPVVNVGNAQTITWPATATLNGTVSDDGLPNGQLTILWQKVTGPGNVTFAPADQPKTTATFSTPGNYVLILIANDGALNNHALVAIQVNGRAPAAPSDLQATAISPTEIKLTWTDNATNETGFMVSDGTAQFSIGADMNLFINSGLPPNSYRCYRVYALNDYGESDLTDWACTTTLPLQIDELNVRVQDVQDQYGQSRGLITTARQVTQKSSTCHTPHILSQLR